MRRSKSTKVGQASLAQSVAHELNNIAASLFGFVELAAERVDRDSTLLSCLGEIRIGVARVANLAAVLEALAEAEGAPVRGAVEYCIGADAPSASADRLSFRWDCDPETEVDADPERVQRALRTLTRLAPGPPGPDLSWTISRAASAIRCSFCGADIPSGSVQVTLTAEAVRLSDTGGADPPRARGSFSQLVVAGGVHAAHMGGGHVTLDAAQHSISLILPSPGVADISS